MTPYVVYDVFTDKPFGGNQLAVFPDATGIPEDQLQSITAEFNFSEVTFVYPPEDPNHTARVRIFTPTMEIPFAGHPTIGTAIALRDGGHVGEMVLELGVGPIPCTFTGKDASFTTSAPFEQIAEPPTTLVARALGLEPDQITSKTHPPTQATLGLPFVIAELTDRATLTACTTDIAVFREGATEFPAGLDFAIFAYTRSGSKIDARMFAPLDNIPEDPATGSACATLAALLYAHGHTGNLTITQGEDMGRTSTIKAQATDTSVTITGTAVKTMEGHFLA